MLKGIILSMVLFQTVGHAFDGQVVHNGNLCQKNKFSDETTFINANCDGKLFGALTGKERLASYLAGDEIAANKERARANWICSQFGFTKAKQYFLKTSKEQPYLLFAYDSSWELVRTIHHIPEGIEWGTGYEIPSKTYYGKFYERLTCIKENQ